MGVGEGVGIRGEQHTPEYSCIISYPFVSRGTAEPTSNGSETVLVQAWKLTIAMPCFSGINYGFLVYWYREKERVKER